MNNDEARTPRIHKDPALFKEAVGFTAAKTGFSKRLIEKDFFCTVLLAYLASQRGSKLVFKGGTCLAKVHAEFYRMSSCTIDQRLPLEEWRSMEELGRLGFVHEGNECVTDGIAGKNDSKSMGPYWAEEGGPTGDREPWRTMVPTAQYPVGGSGTLERSEWSTLRFSGKGL